MFRRNSKKSCLGKRGKCKSGEDARQERDESFFTEILSSLGSPGGCSQGRMLKLRPRKLKKNGERERNQKGSASLSYPTTHSSQDMIIVHSAKDHLSWNRLSDEIHFPRKDEKVARCKKGSRRAPRALRSGPGRAPVSPVHDLLYLLDSAELIGCRRSLDMERGMLAFDWVDERVNGEMGRRVRKLIMKPERDPSSPPSINPTFSHNRSPEL